MKTIYYAIRRLIGYPSSFDFEFWNWFTICRTEVLVRGTCPLLKTPLFCGKYEKRARFNKNLTEFKA